MQGIGGTSVGGQTDRAKRRRSSEMSNDKKLLPALRLGKQKVREGVILGSKLHAAEEKYGLDVPNTSEDMARLVLGT